MDRLDRIKGCLLGGAIGDALGAPVKILGWPAIEAKFGPSGIIDFALNYGLIGAITDNTQMMLFTAEGLLRAFVRGSLGHACHVPSVTHHALLRWLMTQDGQSAMPVSRDSWLIDELALWSRRAPRTTCLSALKANTQLGMRADNYSKGCGAVMSVAPCAFFGDAFKYAAEYGCRTLGHSTGYMAGGLFADILQRMVDRQGNLEHVVTESLAIHGQKVGMEETCGMLERVLFFFYEGYRPTPQRIADFGAGRVAEEALAIGLWCALSADSFEEGVINAVNHSGESDITGLIAGHLLGVQYGPDAIPARWYEKLELRNVIEQVAKDIGSVPRDFSWVRRGFDSQIEQSYPDH